LKKEFKALTVDEVQDISAQEGWDVKYQQLDKGKFKAKFTEISSNRFVFSSENFSGKIHISGASPIDLVSFGISSVNAKYNGKLLESSHIVYLPNGNEIDFVGSKKAQVSVIYVPLEDLNRRIQYLDIDGLSHIFKNPYIIANARGSHLLSQLNKLKQLEFPDDKIAHIPRNSSELIFEETIDLMVDNLIASISNLIDASHLKLHKNYKRAKHLKEFMMNNLNTQLSITEMCEISGLNRRNLFYSFKNYFGTSPYNYFLLLRLNAIREVLLKEKMGDVKIGDVMSRFNFYHFPDFSDLYKKSFGESPSQTLTRK
jgi:AraC family transcriptional regulator, ethanolamine operon transcriptional activator